MSVTRADIDAICAALPGAVYAEPPELISSRVGGKMFACVGLQDDAEGVSVKTPDAETARMLIETTTAIRAKYFHASWVRLVSAETDLDEARHRIAASYDIVRASLPRKARDLLPPREAV